MAFYDLDRHEREQAVERIRLLLLKDLRASEKKHLFLIFFSGYKKGCLEKVLAHLKNWENKSLVALALEEIIDVHVRYSKFAALSREEAITMIGRHF